MAVAQGVAMQSHYILPYLPALKGITGLYYRNNLSDKGRLKLKVYELYTNEHLEMSTLGKIYEVHISTISRWIKDVKNAKNIKKYQILEPKSTCPHSTNRLKKSYYNTKMLLQSKMLMNV